MDYRTESINDKKIKFISSYFRADENTCDIILRYKYLNLCHNRTFWYNLLLFNSEPYIGIKI